MSGLMENSKRWTEWSIVRKVENLSGGKTTDKDAPGDKGGAGTLEGNRFR